MMLLRERREPQMLKRKPPAQLELFVSGSLEQLVPADHVLAVFLLGIVHDRRLMREVQAGIAVRRFIGCGLRKRLPDHSSPAWTRRHWAMRGMPARRRLPCREPQPQDGGGQRRLSGAAARSAAAPSMEHHGSAGSANAAADDRKGSTERPRPGMGWAGPCGSAFGQHEGPALPDGRRMCTRFARLRAAAAPDRHRGPSRNLQKAA